MPGSGSVKKPYSRASHNDDKVEVDNARVMMIIVMMIKAKEVVAYLRLDRRFAARAWSKELK